MTDFHNEGNKINLQMKSERNLWHLTYENLLQNELNSVCKIYWGSQM